MTRHRPWKFATRAARFRLLYPVCASSAGVRSLTLRDRGAIIKAGYELAMNQGAPRGGGLMVHGVSTAVVPTGPKLFGLSKGPILR